MSKEKPEDHIGLAHTIARSIYLRLNTRGVEFEDVLSGVYTVLLRACELYRPEKGYKFSTYFSASCRYSVSDIMCIAYGAKKSDENRKLRFSRDMLELDYKFGDITLGDMIGVDNDPDRPAPLNAFGDIKKLIGELTERDQSIFFHRIQRGETLEQVGNRVGITKEAVRLAQIRIMNLIREKASSSRFPHLRDYAESVA
jgi:RNA polymerase sigma factor (sigma-70 family)